MYLVEKYTFAQGHAAAMSKDLTYVGKMGIIVIFSVT